jgi:XTP/dITP diphosphohydrolase
LQKARHYHQLTGRPCLADDSGLEIDALDGAPGLHSSRFGGEETPHEEKIRLVLEALTQVPEERRTARFRCVAVAVGVGPEPLVGEGVCPGRIALAPAGAHGFGYDPIFWVPSEGATMAELPEGRKHQISHRGRAMRALAQKLLVP